MPHSLKTNSSAPVTIEPYRPGLETGIADLIVPIQREEFGIPITSEEQPDLRDIPQFYQHGTGGFWVALDGEQVVGSIALLDIGNCEAALRKMFVHAEYRGSGSDVAKALLVTLLDYAQEKEVSTIYLGTTSKFLAAHRFYEKNGFTLVDIATLPESFPRMSVDTRFYRYDIDTEQESASLP